MKVADVLKQKTAAVEAVEAAAPLAAAIERFSSVAVRCLVVTDGGRVVGMLTMRDLLKVLHRGGAPFDAPVSEAMSKDVASATPETPLADVEHLIVSRGVNHVPVLDGEKLIGVVTLSDILRVHLDDVAGLNSELRRYIHGPHAL